MRSIIASGTSRIKIIIFPSNYQPSSSNILSVSEGRDSSGWFHLPWSKTGDSDGWDESSESLSGCLSFVGGCI